MIILKLYLKLNIEQNMEKAQNITLKKMHQTLLIALAQVMSGNIFLIIKNLKQKKTLSDMFGK